MTKIPFSIYDFFAYLSSGSVIVATVDCLFGSQWLSQEAIGLVLGLCLVFLSYVVGHVVAHFAAWLLEQCLVARLLKRPARVLMGESASFRVLAYLFPGYHKPLREETRRRVQSRMQSRGFEGRGEALFAHAYAVVTQSERVQQRLDEFRNQYGFARNMAFGIIIASVMLAIGSCHACSPQIGWWSAIAVVLGLGMLYRYLKFLRQYSYHVLLTYSELEVT